MPSAAIAPASLTNGIGGAPPLAVDAVAAVVAVAAVGDASTSVEVRDDMVRVILDAVELVASPSPMTPIPVPVVLAMPVEVRVLVGLEVTLPDEDAGEVEAVDEPEAGAGAGAVPSLHPSASEKSSGS